jgi:hypothetical protein
LTTLMSFFTLFGEQVIPLLVICFLYWCVDKRAAVFAALNLFMGLTINQALKAVFHVSRPWLLDSRVVPEESALNAATGYSFPSGHTANAISAYGAVALYYKKRPLTWLCAVVIALVAVSRLYLGVHTPQDVLGSLLIGGALLFASMRVLRWMDKGSFQERAVCVGGIAVAALLAVLTSGMSAHLTEGKSLLMDAYKASGGSVGFFTALYFERTRIRFQENAAPSRQLVKFFGGLFLVALLLAGAKYPLNALLGEAAGGFVRYMLVAFTAVAGWPFLFTRFLKEKRAA